MLCLAANTAWSGLGRGRGKELRFWSDRLAAGARHPMLMLVGPDWCGEGRASARLPLGKRATPATIVRNDLLAARTEYNKGVIPFISTKQR